LSSASNGRFVIRETPEGNSEYTKDVPDLVPLSVPSRRFMVFVPDAVPHFLLACLEDIGWTIRDYSSGQPRLMPISTLGVPIDQLVQGPRAKGCFAFGAPRVPISDANFWKCLTDELGKRFPGARTVVESSSYGYPLLAESDFKAVTERWDPAVVESLRCSPRSSEWTTWNAIHLLLAAHRREGWWHEITKAATRINPANYFSCVASSVSPQVGFWKSLEPSEEYDQWRRAQLRQTGRKRDRVRADDRTALEPPARVDLIFEGADWIVFAESRIRPGLTAGAQHDPRRNRIVQLADCLVRAAKGRRCALWIFARDRTTAREYMELVERYRSSPEMFAAELPYHPAETLYALAERLTVMQWSNVVGSLTLRKSIDDPVTARVRKELGRRIHVAPMAAAAGA
jgi:hypothetical protein